MLQLSGLFLRQPRPPLVGKILRHAAQVQVGVLGEDRAVEHLEKQELSGQRLIAKKPKTITFAA